MSNMEIDQHMVDKFDFKRRVGKGAYGIVWKAVDRRTKEVVAVKKIFDAFKNKTDAQRTYREITFLRAFGTHDNVIKLKSIHKAVNNMDIYLVFEYLDTDLHNVISQGNILADIHKRFIMYQLFKATRFLHAANVVHRDQKPSNILLDKNCRCKLADFGLARSLSKNTDNNYEGLDNPLTDYVATRWYRPPEVLVASKRYTYGIDMWSLGCILAEMLLGKAIFPGTSTVDQMERILTVLGPPAMEDIKAICSSGVGVGLLSRAPRNRCPLKELLKGHSSDAVNLVSQLLVLNPEKRLTAQEAMKHRYVRRFVDEEELHEKNRISLFSEDCQWSIEQYRNRLYEMANEDNPPRYEEFVLSHPRTTSRAKSYSQLPHNGEKNTREKSSSHHSRRLPQSNLSQYTVEQSAESQKTSGLLPPVEATSSGQPRHCGCKKIGYNRNNVFNVTYKVPQVVPQGPTMHNLNKLPGDTTFEEGDWKPYIPSMLDNPSTFLPQAASTARTVPFSDTFRSSAVSMSPNVKQLKQEPGWWYY